MRRGIALLCAVVLFSGLLAAPAAAGEKLEVTIETEQTTESEFGTFTVGGDAAGYLCPSGTLASENTTIIWLSEDTFKIWQDKVLTCDETGEVFVLELTNTIVIDLGGVPGKGTWKLKDSTGFDPSPKGAGDILWGETGETYTGFLKVK